MKKYCSFCGDYITNKIAGCGCKGACSGKYANEDMENEEEFETEEATEKKAYARIVKELRAIANYTSNKQASVELRKIAFILEG